MSNATSVITASADESDADRYYLTSDYDNITSRTGVEVDQTDGSNGSSQIRIGTSQNAVIVVKADNLSEKTCAMITYIYI